MEVGKREYGEYVKKITELLKKEEFYTLYAKNISSGKNDAKLIYHHNEKRFDLDWVEQIEDCLIPLDSIVRNPRKHIVIEEDIIDISLARSITTDSIKHLAQHTNLISSVDKNGMVLPNKILNTSKEESFEIYENRFIYTLLKKLRDFITKRFDLIKSAYASSEMVEMSFNSAYNLGKTKMQYKLDVIAALPTSEVMDLNTKKLSNLERVAKLDRIVGDFLNSAFAKQMVSSAPVRPPIQRTNVILKHQDFKKALTLWQFIETYEKVGFYVDNKDVAKLIEEKTTKQLMDLAYLNTLIFESITSQSDLLEEVDLKADKTLLDLPPEREREKVEVAEEKEKIKETSDDVDEETEKEKADLDDDLDVKEEEEKTEESQEEEKAEEESDVKREEIIEEIIELSEDEEDKAGDDFPDIDFELSEARNIYEKAAEEEKISALELRKVNYAVDRILLAKKIEKAKFDEKEKEKLIAKKKLEQEKFIKVVISESILQEKEEEQREERKRKEEQKFLKLIKSIERKELLEKQRIEKELKEKEKKELKAQKQRLLKVAEREKEKLEKERRKAEIKLLQEKHQKRIISAKKKAEMEATKIINKLRREEAQKEKKIIRDREALEVQIKEKEAKEFVNIKSKADEYMHTLIALKKNQIESYLALIEKDNPALAKYAKQELRKSVKQTKIIEDSLMKMQKNLQELE